MTTNGFTIRSLTYGDLKSYAQRLVQIFLDAFTTGGYAHNVDIENELTVDEYLHNMICGGGSALLAFDGGMLAHPQYPIGFLFATSLRCDELLDQTSIATTFNVEKCQYIASLAVDLGHKRRGIGQSLIATYLSSLDSNQTEAVFLRTNEADSGLHQFYQNAGFEKLDETALHYGFVPKRYFCYRFQIE